MSYLVLARKWRPKQFKELTGQDVIVRTLKNALASDHLAHAYLMTGIRGVGKTTISRLIAMAVNCPHAKAGEPCSQCESCVSIAKGNNLDVQEMDAASHTGVDDIREILDGVRYPPVHLKRKVYIIDEAHMLSKNAFNALLKTLEEPPESVMFILATTESDKLPITVRSRCQRFDLRRLDVDEISAYLALVLRTEGFQADEDALQVIARASEGSVRDALSLCERVLVFSGQYISIDDVQQSLGLIGSEQTIHLTQAVLTGDAIAAIGVLRQGRELGLSPAKLLQAVSEQIHEMMCCQLDAALLPQGISADTQTWLIAAAKSWENQALDMRYQVLVHGLRDLYLVDEQRGSEMIVARLAHLNAISPPTASMPAAPIANRTEKKTLKSEPLQNSLHISVTHASVAATPPPKAIASAPDAISNTTASITTAEFPANPEAKPQPTPLAKPNTWEETMLQYHRIKPGVAALLEHCICQTFTPELRLLLDAHQWSSLSLAARQDFESWLARPVVWQQRHNEAGESLIESQKREAEEAIRRLWEQAEAEPHVQAIKASFGCRITDIEPPNTNISPIQVNDSDDDTIGDIRPELSDEDEDDDEDTDFISIP